MVKGVIIRKTCQLGYAEVNEHSFLIEFGMLTDTLTKLNEYFTVFIIVFIMMVNLVNLMGFRITVETNVVISIWDLLDEAN